MVAQVAIIKNRNRMEKQKTKSGVFWCDYCDAYKVGDGQKCKVCKKRFKTNRHRKSENQPALTIDYDN